MALDNALITLIGVAIAAIPGTAAWFQGRNQKREITAKVDDMAFQRAKDFYSGTLDEYKEELIEARKAKKEAQDELKDALKELRESRTDRDFLTMRVTMLERENKELEVRIQTLESKLRSLGEDLPQPPPPNNEEGN